MLVITCSVSACAVVRSGPDGSVHVAGLADVQVTLAEPSSGMMGNVVTIRTVGLTLNLLNSTSDFAIGYFQSMLALLRNCRPILMPSGPYAVPPQWKTASGFDYAYEHDSRSNRKRFFGLVDVTVPFGATHSAHAGKFRKSEILGLDLVQQQKSLQVIIGYSNSTSLAIGPDVIVTLDNGNIACPMSTPERLHVGYQ